MFYLKLQVLSDNSISFYDSSFNFNNLKLCYNQEILVNNNAIANLIREAKASQVYSQIQIGAKFGMQTLEQCLSELVSKSIITTDEEMYKCNRPTVLKGLLEEQNSN